MSKLVLGIGFLCLFAGEAMAVGFVIPRLPDFELQRGYGQVAAAGCDTNTDCVPAHGYASKVEPTARPHGHKPTSAIIK